MTYKHMFNTLLIMCLVLPAVFAGGEHASEDSLQGQIESVQENVENSRSVSDNYATLYPWYYFKQGKWFEGIFMLLLWYLTARGIYTLFLIVAHRAVQEN